MENKLNHTVIKDYSATYADKVCDEFFKDHIKIDGSHILNLCPVKQINLFIINKLFEAWQFEMQKLKSPFFDYEDEEVKTALEDFLNILSRHIAIGENEFKPLLEQAVRDTILLIFSPYHYYVEVFNTPDKFEITLEELKSSSKFIKINQPILEALVKRFEKDQLQRVSGEEKKQLIDEVFENLKAAPEDFDEYARQLSQTEPLHVDDLYIKEEIRIQEVPSNKNKEEPPIRPTLNDHFKASGIDTLADLHQKKKIDDIKKHLTINQRYMFTKTLFGDNSKEFDVAVSNLDNYNSYVDAFNYLRKDYASKYRWKMDSEEVIEFLEIVSKKY